MGSTRGVRFSVRFDLIDGPSWRVSVDDGRVAVKEASETADIVVETREDSPLAILKGEQNANTALLSGGVKVRGDTNTLPVIEQFLLPAASP